MSCSYYLASAVYRYASTKFEKGSSHLCERVIKAKISSLRRKDLGTPPFLNIRDINNQSGPTFVVKQTNILRRQSSYFLKFLIFRNTINYIKKVFLYRAVNILVENYLASSSTALTMSRVINLSEFFLLCLNTYLRTSRLLMQL